MRRRTGRTIKRGWVAISVFVLGGAALVAAGRGEAPTPETGPSPAQTVALRFPQAALASAQIAVAATIVGERRLALFSPEPMAPQTGLKAVAETPAEVAEPSPPPQLPAAPPLAHVAHAPAKPAVAPVHRTATRPGYVFNDAQIASIKRRLNLTPDQERMWPAVEAALRSIAYAKAHGEPHRRSARVTQVASVDPDSPEVQGLKSAAFPLIMSFSAEQKSEVRSLAHVMGLDKLAAQF